MLVEKWTFKFHEAQCSPKVEYEKGYTKAHYN